MIKKKDCITENRILEKLYPAYLQENYPYKASSELITDIDRIEDIGVLYEIKCLTEECELSARSQGVNIKDLYDKITSNGCPVCKGKKFEIRIVRKV